MRSLLRSVIPVFRVSNYDDDISDFLLWGRVLVYQRVEDQLHVTNVATTPDNEIQCTAFLWACSKLKGVCIKFNLPVLHICSSRITSSDVPLKKWISVHFIVMALMDISLFIIDWINTRDSSAGQWILVIINKRYSPTEFCKKMF